MGELKQYRAFLSYSHKDSQLAKKLHRSLENYKAPKSVKAHGKRLLGPIFRDEDELEAASNLSDRIKTALEQSEFLIVLASPNAKASKWVNDEIRFFREMKGDANILCALLHPDPNASFPEALLETGNEPLAAELTSKNFRLGVTQIAAPMLGVSLDDLIQRDLRKLRRRVTGITVSACAALLVMGSLTWAAISARQEAEQRRQDAEEQIEFMITDLKDELETVGRLEALEAVAQLAVNYYEGYPLSTHDDDALGRRARVFHMLGSVQEQQGNFEQATPYFTRAFEATKTLLERSPLNPDRVFDHSQSAFWIGSTHYSHQNYEEAQKYFQNYHDLLLRLQKLEGETDRVIAEQIYGWANLGKTALAKGERTIARQYLNQVLAARKSRHNNHPEDLNLITDIADTRSSLARIDAEDGHFAATVQQFDIIISLLNSVDPQAKNFQLQFQKVIALRSLSSTHLLMGNIDEAAETIRKGAMALAPLIDIAPNNVEVQFEKIQQDILKFHLAISTEKPTELHPLLKNIQYELAKKPDNSEGQFLYETLQRVTNTFPLYIAIFEQNEKEKIELARSLLKETQPLLLGDIKHEASDKYLQPYLLSLAVLNTSPHPDILTSYCDVENPKLAFLERSIVTSFLKNNECDAIKISQVHPETSFRLALEKLKF